MSLRNEIDKLLGRQADMVTKIIVINVIIFLVANIFIHIIGFSDPSYFELRYVSAYLALPSSPVELLFHPWTLVTYMFLHTNLMHLLFNMLWLYWIGIIFVDFMGQQRVLYVYLLGGLAGGVLFILTSNTFLPESGGYLMGASAGIMAVVIAAAVLVPDYELYLLFFGRVKLKYLALGAFLLSTVVDFSVNSGGKVSHIGGALFGYIYMQQYRKGNDISAWLDNLFKSMPSIVTLFKGRKYLRGNAATKKNISAIENQKKIDEILDKISHSGYDALSKEEKDYLFKAKKN